MKKILMTGSFIAALAMILSAAPRRVVINEAITWKIEPRYLDVIHIAGQLPDIKDRVVRVYLSDAPYGQYSITEPDLFEAEVKAPLRVVTQNRDIEAMSVQGWVEFNVYYTGQHTWYLNAVIDGVIYPSQAINF